MNRVEGRPLPAPSRLTEGFWEAASRHELVVQCCGGCGRLRHYPKYRCPHCHSDEWSWTPLHGTGTVYSFAISHRAFHPAWTDNLPYPIVTVTLDEGVRMVGDLDPDDAGRVAIGQRVEVFFEDVPDGFSIPRFRIAD
jgi:uncharacterized OB-fold protein